ncbi:MAG: FtsX-like permease family protein, partial [Candidatus Heimdallarchaeota archaeon]
NFFDYALDQSLKISSIGSTYHISGVIIDAFYSGYAGYMGINETRSILNLTDVEINFLALKIDPNSYSKVVEGLNNASSILGENFNYMQLDSVFDDNLEFLSNLALYPMFLMIIVAILTILTLYNYQKSGIMEKARDFLIMKAIGSQNRSIRRILFLESIFVIVPSLLLSLGIGMILNSLILFARVFLPPLFIPFMLLGILLGVFLIFNFFSLIPIMRKINKFSIKDFEIY